jgi:hypothetical protein
MLNRLCPGLFVMALSGAWLFLFVGGAIGQESPAPQSSSAAVQANAATVQSFTEFLKAQAARSEEATRLERDVIRHALTVFTWIVGVVGTLLVVGAGALGWFMAKWSRASKTDIQQEVRTQLQARVMEAIDAEITTTRTRVASLSKEAENFSRQLAEAKDKVAVAEERLNEQRDTITKLVGLTLGPYPYSYLKSIHAKKTGADPNHAFLLQPGNSFKRELNFLIDMGYLENVELSKFQDLSNIIDELKITETGELYLKLRESLSAKPL